MLRLAVALLGALALPMCDRGAPGGAAAPPASTVPTPEGSAAAEPAKDGDKGKEKDKSASASKRAEPEDAENFPVPFAWETSRDEPLAMARQFVRDLLSDNRAYMGRGAPFFAAFKDAQTPRATVITCSDSRVQTPAFDASPENDDFMIRNIGNQIGNAAGSVEYGIEHLGTPVLLVLGHTGCGAVKAAMGDSDALSPAIRAEVEALKVKKSKPPSAGAPDPAWTEAVIENVNNQVALALTKFGGRVQAGKLTVIGAVYDFRNDMGQGIGKVNIVNVNGNDEAQRMRSFVDAVEAQPLAGGKPGTTRAGGARNVEAASARIEQALLDTLKEAARLDPAAGGKRGETPRVQITPTSKPRQPESSRVQVTGIPP
jgi:carbonic anhydrase